MLSKERLRMGTPVSYLSLFLISVAIYLVWMDVGLYLELQRTPPRHAPAPTLANGSGSSYSFSPFRPITVKLLMLSATIQFIDEPLGYFTVMRTNVAQILSPNAVSLLGVLVALLSAKFFVSDSLRQRQLGVLLFKIRDFCDALDGNLAREISSSHSLGHVPHRTWGWMVDGTCDGLADIIRFLAFAGYLQKVWSNSTNSKFSSNSYSLLDTKPVSGCGYPGRVLSWIWQTWLKYRTAMHVVMWVGFQSLFSAVLWNYFIINYNLILETDLKDSLPGPVNYHALTRTQNNILRSSSMWMICYFWRLVNPQNLGQIQMLAVLYGKEVELLTSIQYLGYLPPAVTGLCSYIYLNYARSLVISAAQQA